MGNKQQKGVCVFVYFTFELSGSLESEATGHTSMIMFRNRNRLWSGMCGVKKKRNIKKTKGRMVEEGDLIPNGGYYYSKFSRHLFLESEVFPRTRDGDRK